MQKHIYRWKFLKLEHQETKEIYNQCILKFNKDFRKYINLDPQPQREEVDTKPKLEASQSSKDLHKQIVKETHPDKTGGDKKKRELFDKAQSAYEKDDVLELVAIIADDLGLEIELEESSETIKTIQTTCENIEKDILFMRSTVAWAWGTGNEAIRNRIHGEMMMKQKQN